jgi:threonine aldolase
VFFASDNAGPAHPAILTAMTEALGGYALGYGDDAATHAVEARIREIFEAPRAAVRLVSTGTAANALLLATLSNPWDSIFCTPQAHVWEDECNAVEAMSGGASMAHVAAGPDAKMSPDALMDAIAGRGGAVHRAQPGPLTLTSVTERGTLYTPEEIAELTDNAATRGMKVHLDGARFANALVALGCTPAEMTWKAGVDAVSFGGTKNGCPAVEACVLFDPDPDWELQLRRKRGGHLLSRHRTLSGQMQGYLAGDLWLDLARAANTAAARLATGLRGLDLGDTLLAEPEANMIFVSWPMRLHDALRDAGAVYYVMGHSADPDALVTGRFVCDWATTDEAVDSFLGHLRRVLGTQAA